MSGLINIIYFLVSLFFDLTLFVLWIRLALRYYRVSFLHPVSQVVYTLTNPIAQPIEQLIYPKNAAPSRYDWVGFGLILGMELIKFILLGLLAYGRLLPLSYLLVFTLADLIIQPCNLLFYMILIRVIMSWVNPHWQNPAVDIMKLITAPILKFGRWLVPNISGFDFSPLIILVLLKVITLFISTTLPLHLL